MRQKLPYEVVTFSLGPLEYRTSYTLPMGGVGITPSLTTHTWVYPIFSPGIWREGVLLSEKGGIVAHFQPILSLWRIAAIQVVLLVDPALGRGKCGGRSRAGAMQQCAGLFVNRHRTHVALTVRHR